MVLCEHTNRESSRRLQGFCTEINLALFAGIAALCQRLLLLMLSFLPLVTCRKRRVSRPWQALLSQHRSMRTDIHETRQHSAQSRRANITRHSARQDYDTHSNSHLKTHNTHPNLQNKGCSLHQIPSDHKNRVLGGTREARRRQVC
jgi:hypothetical protein